MDEMLAKEDLGIVHSRIQETVKILSNFKELRDPNKKRTEYMSDLMNDVVAAYDYNMEMVEVFFSLFPPAEAIK
jgi:25S rRNA (cytosine2870-C5)-methyltransferase